MLDLRGPATSRASRSARRRSPGSGRPIGTSTPIRTASGKRSSMPGNRRSSAASAKRPSSSATPIQPPRAASTPSVSMALPVAPELCPDQIAVGDEKAEREQRQRREAAEIPPDGEREGRAERQRHQQPRQVGPKQVLRGRREEEREEQQVGQAEVRRGRLAGDREGEREVREHVRVLRNDHLRRAAPDGVRVDPGDDQRHEHDPAQRLEVLEEREADERHGEELREVLRRVPTGDVEHPGEHAQRRADGEQSACGAKRQHEPDEREARGDQYEAEERDVPPRRGVPETIVERVVEREGCQEPYQGGDTAYLGLRELPDPQYGGSSAHQLPRGLNAFQNWVFARASSSDESMSGTTSTWTVAVKRCSAPGLYSRASASGNSSEFRNSTDASPIVTISFGCTMCSSRVRKARDSSSFPPANLRQFVPWTALGAPGGPRTAWGIAGPRGPR